MNHGTDYIKIRTAMALNPSFDLTPNGFRQEFKEKLIDHEEQFRQQIIIPINDAIGLHNWAILFRLTPPLYLCDIYADDKAHFPKIASIVKSRIIDVEFQIFYQGTVDDYLKD